jgi:hypothetical protein
MHLPALTFVLAPLPNTIFSQCGGDEFSASYEGSGPVDLGRFITSIIVVTGFAFPVVLTHSEVITPGACAMSIVGGGYVLSNLLDTDTCSHVIQTGVRYNIGILRCFQAGR